jgi:hypothetical protein
MSARRASLAAARFASGAVAGVFVLGTVVGINGARWDGVQPDGGAVAGARWDGVLAGARWDGVAPAGARWDAPLVASAALDGARWD